MAAQGGLNQCGFPHTADLLAQGHLVTNLHGYILRQAGILGSITPVVGDHHGVTHGIVLEDPGDPAVGGSADRGAGLGGNVHAVVDPPVPGGLVIA